MGPEEEAMIAEMMQAPANVGPAAIPQANNGNMAAAMAQVKNAIEMLQQALPMIPLGSDLHESAVNAVKMLSKHMESTQENSGIQLGGLISAAQQMQQQLPMQALASQFPQPGAPAMGAAPAQQIAA